MNRKNKGPFQELVKDKFFNESSGVKKWEVYYSDVLKLKPLV